VLLGVPVTTDKIYLVYVTGEEDAIAAFYEEEEASVFSHWWVAKNGGGLHDRIAGVSSLVCWDGAYDAIMKETTDE
jgi:hypothetical protein